jgi:hypothetical protein
MLKKDFQERFSVFFNKIPSVIPSLSDEFPLLNEG